jgi:uncharacterized Zn finger protein
MSWFQWRPYVSVAARRANAEKKMERFRKKGVDIQPIRIEGRKIAQTFWGQAWCDHLEKFSDFENRLPRGRTYVRNGSVCHLEIAPGEIKAMVSGSELYNVNIAVKKLPGKRWSGFKQQCAGKIGSLLELLQGRLSDNVMSVVTHRDNGLFPVPAEITLKCSCPDWAVMCKHVAAVLYGVGARLDEKPELLFLLRGVNHEELISAEAGSDAVARAVKGDDAGRIAEADLSSLFGIEISDDETKVSEERSKGQTARAVKRMPALKKAERSRRTAGSGKRGQGGAKNWPRRQRAQEGIRAVRKAAAEARSSSPKGRKVSPASGGTTVNGGSPVKRSSPTKKP